MTQNILTEKAVLAALNVGGWEPRKRDDKASAVVHKHYKAEADSGNYNKALFNLKDEAWTRIVKARSALRDYHYAMTTGWIHKGAQLLACAMYLDYNAGVVKLIRDYYDAAQDFIAHHYDRLKAEAKRTRNGLYHEEDYPSKAELERKFYAEVSFLPVPDAGHVVVDLVSEGSERIRADTERQVREALDASQAEVWMRLYEPVAKMAAVLADPEKNGFHDTLVTNVREIAERARGMNLAGDKRLDGVIRSIQHDLTKASAQTLKDNPDVRSENARKAAALAAKMASLMPRKPQ